MKVIILKKLSYITAIILTVFLVTVMMTVTVLSEESLLLRVGLPVYTAEDLKNVNIVVDVYKIADAEEVSGGYHYIPTENFAELEVPDLSTQQDDSNVMRDFAAEAKAIAQSTERPVDPNFKTQLTGTDWIEINVTEEGEGLYLLLAHGNNSNDTACSASYNYTFPPIVTPLPSKEDVVGEARPPVIGTDEDSWFFQMDIILLATRTSRPAGDPPSRPPSPPSNLIASGTIENTSVHWKISKDGALTISGTGEIPDYFNQKTPPWSPYNDQITQIIIKQGITSIGWNVFSNIRYSKLEIPDSVTDIDTSTFSSPHCFPEIHYNGTLSQWLSAGLHFHEGLFWNISGCNLFVDGTLVTDLTIPPGIFRIPNYAFSKVVTLESVDFSTDVEEIGCNAFWGCTSLKTVTFPASIQKIGRYAFDHSLESVEFEGNAPQIDSCVFGSDFPTGSELQNLKDPIIYYHTGTTGWSSPKWNGYYAARIEPVSDYTTLDSDNRNSQGILFTLNETAKTATVGDNSHDYNNAGYYGAQKGVVQIPDTVTKEGNIYKVIGINHGAFSRNKHIVSISIGANVSSIMSSAFNGCIKLKSVSVSEKNEYYLSEDDILYDRGKLYLYLYPAGKADSSFSVPSSVKSIGQYAFFDNLYLKTLYIGRNVTAIYQNAICGLKNLENVTLPFIGMKENQSDELYRHSTPAFHDVFGEGSSYYEYNGGVPENLKKISILGGALYPETFQYCDSVEEIMLPDIPETIPEKCFIFCNKLQKITFLGSSRNDTDGDLILPEGIKNIENDSFCGCKSFSSVTLPVSLMSIGNGAFAASGVEQFTVSSGNSCFSTDKWGVLYNKDQTALIQYPSGRQWPYYNVADTTTRIEMEAFSECENLVNLFVPATVTEMGSCTINDCPNLTLCCYIDSAAYHYALDNRLSVWYMDNKVLQGIHVYSLPEQSPQIAGKVNLQGLYIVGNYEGKELQIDDYALSYDQQTSGIKTVTVSCEGKQDTFEMALFSSNENNIISFNCDNSLEDTSVLIAVYDDHGAMLVSKNAIVSEGKASIGINDSIYQKVSSAKLFVLNKDTFTPSQEARTLYLKFRQGPVELEDEEIEQEEKFYHCLQTINKKKNTLEYLKSVDQTVLEFWKYCTDCISPVFDDRSNGYFLSKEYIRSSYNLQILTMKELYEKMDENQKEQVFNILLRCDKMSNLRIVMQYLGFEVI